jgi:hypothetical protein
MRISGINSKVILAILLVWASMAALVAQTAPTVFATGFNNPRGLKFGPDGNLYVAEGGAGGSSSTQGICPQVPAPVGPYTGGFTARISKVSPNGAVTVVADHLPSSQTSADQGSLVSGVADVAFIGHTLYALVGAAGCSHGLLGTHNGVLRVNSDGTTTSIANLSAFIKGHAAANPNPGDFEPDGTWYSMIEAYNGILFAVEPNHGEFDAILPNGYIQRIADISRVQGHIVPTALAFHDGSFYVGNLDTFPIKDGSAKVMKISPFGEITTAFINFSDIVGLAFDKKGRLYVLENTTGNPFPTPGTGTILRVNGKNNYTTIATGLSLPTAMTFGPDGNLYVSNLGFGPPPVGAGQVVKVVVPAD